MRAVQTRPDPPRLRRFVLLLGASLLASGCAADCEPEPDSAADYSDPDAWLCHPDLADDDCRGPLDTVEVLPDNSVVPFERSITDDSRFDCFYVYPTMDLRLRSQLHEDLQDDSDEVRVVQTQAARFAEVCTVFVPRYRQVTLGTYVGNEAVVQPCFDTAYEDVERAFDAWLALRDDDRGVLLIGHSQGGQITSRLVRERFDADPALRARLVGAMPIGWSVGVAAEDVVGGSSDEVPICTGDDESGCIVAYRSYGAENEAPSPSDRYLEGDEEVCVHPGDVAGGGPAGLSGATFRLGEGALVDLPDGLDVGDADYLVYRDFFSAECRSGASLGLSVSAAPGPGDGRQSPVSFDDVLLSGSSGTHVLDVQFGMLDLVARAEAMGASWEQR